MEREAVIRGGKKAFYGLVTSSHLCEEREKKHSPHRNLSPPSLPPPKTTVRFDRASPFPLTGIAIEDSSLCAANGARRERQLATYRCACHLDFPVHWIVCGQYIRPARCP